MTVMETAQPDVYRALEVVQIRALHGDLADPQYRALPIAEQLGLQADTLWEAHNAGDDRVLFQIQSWWPAAAGRSGADIMAGAFSGADARLTVAREYGYADWAAAVEATPSVSDPAFEAALDSVLAGNADDLQNRLAGSRELATAASAYGHRATLLHYLAANGVESWRQQTPLNAAVIAQVLIDHGANVSAEANMYGGGQTAHDLAVTSAHPAAAGVIEALESVLRPPQPIT